MLKNPYLSVVIPSYNEQKNLDRGVLEEVIQYLGKRDYTWELILTDDGSKDGTVHRLHEFADKHSKDFPGQIKVIENIHAGKGPTVQSGMLYATGEWRLFTDFDQSTPLFEVERLLEFTKQGYEIVIGSREGLGSKREKEPPHRHLMGRGFNLLVQALAIPGIYDTQCGFKLFSGSATDKLFVQMYVYGKQQARHDAFTGAFDVEVLYLARKYGYKIKEVPIQWKHNETDRVSPVKDSLRMLRDILRVRVADFQRKYAPA
jgi:dolichyl-phosphate beta-glucosyltransferase